MATNITTTIATTTTKLVKEIAKTVKVRTVDYMAGGQLSFTAKKVKRSARGGRGRT